MVGHTYALKLFISRSPLKSGAFAIQPQYFKRLLILPCRGVVLGRIQDPRLDVAHGLEGGEGEEERQSQQEHVQVPRQAFLHPAAAAAEAEKKSFFSFKKTWKKRDNPSLKIILFLNCKL